MEAYPNAASVLRSRTIIPPPPSLLALSSRLPSPSSSLSLLPSVTLSEPTLLYSGTPKPSLQRFSLFSNSHTLQTMTLSKCFSQTGPTVPIPEPPGSDPQPDSPLVVVSFYKFADFPDHTLMRNPLKQLCQRLVLTFAVHSFTTLGTQCIR